MQNIKERVLQSGLRVLAIALASVWLLAVSAFAQSTASITGTITDATGAVVPNATVTVRNQNTGEERVIQTDSSGIYLCPLFPSALIA